MNGAIDAAGDVATGMAWARAAEPAAGDATLEVHGACLNCSTALAGRYCHACGQSSHVHKTLGSIVHDLLHGVFHFEGKIWHTVPMLVRRPGELTRRYIDGERAKFVSPLALFLFTVFLMFAVYSAVGPGDLAESFGDRFASMTPKLEQQREQSAAEIAGLERQRADLIRRGVDTGPLDRRIGERRGDLAALQRITGKVADAADKPVVHSDLDWLDRSIQKARANPGLVIYKVQSAAYKFSWALILLSTPFVALLFLWRRRFGLYDHATFVTYSISFMSLLVIALELLVAAGVPGLLIALLALLAPPVHMFVQVRGAYSLRWFSALWRTAALIAGSTIVLALFVLGVIALEVSH